MKFCSECGAQLEDNAVVCSACNAQLEEPTAEPAIAAEAPVSEAPSVKKPVMSKKLIGIIAGGLAVVILLGVLFACMGGGSDPVYGLYYKDGEVYLTDFESEEPILVTDDLGAWDSNVLDSMVMTPDGEYILFPDEIKSGDRHATLLIREATDPEADALKIASKVTRYFVADDSDTVIYLNADGDLCRYSISDEESEDIEKDVTSFSCSEDGQNILFRTEKTKNDKTTITYYRVLDGNIEEPTELPKWSNYDYSDDLTVIVYEEEHKANDKEDKKYKTYMIDESGEEVQIDTQVAQIWIMEDNTVYYTKEGKAVKLSKYIKNDINDESLSTAILSILDSVEVTPYEIYKYDGEPALLVENVMDATIRSYEEKIFTYVTLESSAKVKLSQLTDVGDYDNVPNYVMAELEKAGKQGILVDDEAGALGIEDLYRYGFSEEYDRIYAITDWDAEENCGDLYVADLDGITVGDLEQVGSEVTSAQFCNGDLYYLADGDLYIEGEKKAVAKDSRGCMYLEDADMIIVAYDWNDSAMALGVYDGELVEIYDKIHDYSFMENGIVVYEDEDGDWFYYKNGESLKLEDDIDEFVQIQVGGYAYINW